MDSFKPKNFAEFWPFYVRQHTDKSNRRLHFIGTAFGLVCLAAAIALAQPIWLLGMPVTGYGFAWLGHFMIERNKPATFKFPFYSLLGDYKMFGMMLLGRMDEEVEKAFGRWPSGDPEPS